MRRELARAVLHLPRPLRRKSYLAHVHFQTDEVSSIVFKLAETREEREQAFALLHNMYVRRGLIDQTPSGLKLSVFSLLPTTSIFIGVRDGRVLSTMALIEDSPLGLPMEEIYGEEVARLRLPGRRVAEVGSLAVATGVRGKGLPLLMYNLMFRWAHFYRGVDDLAIAVNPRVEDFYSTLLLFERIGGVRTYETLKQAPAVALRLDLRTGVARYRRIYDHNGATVGRRSPLSNLYRFFCVEEFSNLSLPALPTAPPLAPPRWDPADVSRFLSRLQFDAETLTSEQRRFFYAQYPHLAPAADAPVHFGSRALGYRARRLPSEVLLSAAVKAPSGDNTQPWRFVVDQGAGRISIYLDEARDRSPMNAGQRMARVAIGAALENLVRTVAANGWSAQLEEAEPSALATLRLTDTGSASGEVESVIAARVTNRRVYEGRPIAADVAGRLARDTALRAGVRTYWILQRDRVGRLASLIARADALTLSQPSIRQAFHARVRFDKARDAEVNEGLSIDSLELSAFERFALKMVPRTPDWVMRFSGASRSYAAHVRKLVNSASGLCLIVAPDGQSETDLDVGRAMQRAWLALTAEGLAVQPMMSPLVLENLSEHGPGEIVDSLGRERLLRIREELRRVLPEIGAGRPAVLMRFGFAAAPSGRTGRLRPEWVTTKIAPAADRKPVPAAVALPVAAGKRARQRVLFLAEAVTLANVARSAALASSLDPKRCEVVLACDSRFAKLHGELPFPVRRIHSIPTEQFLRALATGSPIYDAETLSEYVREDLELLRKTSPDVVVGAFRLSLAISARLTNTPYMTLAEPCWNPLARQRIPLADHPSTRFVGVPAAQFVFGAIRSVAFAYHCRPLNRVRQQYGLPSLGSDIRRVFTEADFTLYPDVAELWPSSPLPANHHYLGPIPWSPSVPLPDWWNRLPADRPVVYATLGISGRADLLPVILEAVEGLPVSTVVATAGRVALGPLPEGVFAAEFLPGEKVTARSSLVICNGGSPSVHQALAAGVPVLGLASNMTQLLTMGAVARAGAGEGMRAGSVNAAALRSAILRTLGRPQYAQAAGALANHLARANAFARFQELLAQIPARSSAVA
jgi:UDP:flavonoid glycosyltransferase YjiC (YdhE family)